MQISGLYIVSLAVNTKPISARQIVRFQISTQI